MAAWDEARLLRYVSNLDRNVYVIFNLPEEVIAVIFAYVSRSPLSFRENLKRLLADEELALASATETDAPMARHVLAQEKARQFHEKWVVGYGHSSVAEHAVAHVGVEKISRLASAELELATSFNSFTEYSQRYQRPRRGDVYIPPELDAHPELKARYFAVQEQTFDAYERLLEGLLAYLHATEPRREGEGDKAYRTRLEKMAFEDARYVLTLAVHTNLGLTGNGRSLRDTIVRLLSLPYRECRDLARALEAEVSRVLPTLLRHVRPNDYLVGTREVLDAYAARVHAEPYRTAEREPYARLLSAPDEETATQRLVAHLLLSTGRLSREQAEEASRRMSLAERNRLIEEALVRLRFFDNPVDSFAHVYYEVAFQVSEANWHQLLRHNRKTNFTYQPPTVRNGYTVPPRVRAAGLEAPFTEAIAAAEALFFELEAVEPTLAPYAVTGAHHRQVYASMSLWELYHLINLRTSPEAQWDIRMAMESLYEQVRAIHPSLIRYAKRRA